MVHLVDVTDVSAQAAEYRASRPVYMLFQVDGSDVLLENLRESERARLLEGVNLLLEHYIGRTTGFLRRVASTRYVAVVEERHLTEMIAGKFDILDKMRALDENVGLTLSIGVGHGGTLAECQQMARQSLDMALGRGGDQAAVKTENGFEFYGGVSRSIEKAQQGAQPHGGRRTGGCHPPQRQCAHHGPPNERPGQRGRGPGRTAGVPHLRCARGHCHPQKCHAGRQPHPSL